jgi:hypothetical protein
MLLMHTRLWLRGLSSQACSQDALRSLGEARLAVYLQGAVGLTDAEIAQVIEKHPNILDLDLEGKRAFDAPVHRAVAPTERLSLVFLSSLSRRPNQANSGLLLSCAAEKRASTAAALGYWSHCRAAA